MKGSKVVKIKLDSFGQTLRMQKGCFILSDKNGEDKSYPLIENEVGEAILQSGNTVSIGALVYLGVWNIDTLILSGSGKPVAMLRNLYDDSHVKTRVCQYEALKNEKGIQIAKQVVLKRLESQNLLLRKYGLRQHDIIRIKETIEQIETDNLKVLRRKLLPLEGHLTDRYFSQVFQLIAKDIRTSNNRSTYRAYDALNNNFNFVYTLLKWKVHSALVRAKLEPFLGFLHSEQYGKPSLTCDVMEPFRSLADDFLIGYSKNIRKKDFVLKPEKYVRNKAGKREYLNDSKTRGMRNAFYGYLEKKIEIPRIKHGNCQSIETLIAEECLLLAKFLRGERKAWIPRIPDLRCH
jgi:CRISPR-associated protein Cas1